MLTSREPCNVGGVPFVGVFVCVLLQSYVFHTPVNKKAIKDYYDIIKHPMDLQTLSKVRAPRFSVTLQWSQMNVTVSGVRPS